MTRSNKKQPTDKKPITKLWREIPEGLQGKVRGGQFGLVDSEGDFGLLHGSG